MTRKTIGGITFVKLGRLSFSYSISKKKPSGFGVSFGTAMVASYAVFFALLALVD